MIARFLRTCTVLTTAVIAVSVSTADRSNARPVASESARLLSSLVSNISQDKCSPLVEKVAALVASTTDDATRKSGIDFLESRTELDVSPYQFARLTDQALQESKEDQYFGTIVGAGVTPDEEFLFNRHRDNLGIESYEIEARLAEDRAQLGLAAPTASATIYKCLDEDIKNKTRFELKAVSSRSDETRKAWQSDEFKTDTPSYLAAKKQDEAAGVWISEKITSNTLFSGSALTRRDVFDVFLMFQHSADLTLMIKGFDQFSEQMMERRLPRECYSLLADRTAMLMKKDQIYGTQGRDNADGQTSPIPYSSPNEVDVRRELMNLDPIKEYYSKINNK